MPRPLKIILIALGAVLGLFLVAAIALPLVFDPNDYTAQIETQAKKQTGRDLKLGHLDLKVFPWLAVKAENVKVGNPKDFAGGSFADIQEARVGVHLLPLIFSRKVEVSTVAVTGLVLNLSKDKSGRDNWSEWSTGEKTPEAQPRPVEKGGQQFSIETLDIGGVKIKDVTLNYSDAQAGKHYALDKLNLETGAIEYGKPFEVKFSVSAASKAPAASADITLSGKVSEWDVKGGRYSVDDLLFSIKGKGEKILQNEDATIDAEFKGKIAADLAKAVQVSGLALTFKGGNGQLKADGHMGGDLSFDTVAQQLNAPKLELDTQVTGKNVPGTQNVKFTGGVNYDAKQGNLKLSKALLQAAGLTVATDITGEGLNGSTPKLSGPIAVQKFNLRDLMTKFGVTPPQTADANVLKDVSLNTQYSGSFKNAAFNDFVLKLDQSTMRGTVSVRDFATQAIQFALNVDQIDADRYLAPKASKPGAAGAPAKEEKKGDINDIQIPAETLNKLNAEGTLNVGLLKVNGLKFSDAQVKLAGGKGEIKTQNLTAKLYGGSVNLSNRFTPGSKPQYNVKTTLAALNAAPFLQDLTGKDPVSGLGSLNFNLTSGGLTVGDLRKSLNGDLGFKLENGAVKGFNLGQILRKGQAMLAGNANYTENAPQQTDFTAITGTAQIINGILKSDKLDGASPLFRLLGSGEVNLVNETINYIARPTIVASGQGQGGKGLENLKGITIPIVLSGNLFSPSYKLDLQEALKQAALQKFTGPEQQQELKEKLNKEIGRGLGRLFGNKPQPAPEPTPAPAPQQKAP